MGAGQSGGPDPHSASLLRRNAAPSPRSGGKGAVPGAFVDKSDVEALSAALADKPALLLVETPSNPLMRVGDVRSETNGEGLVVCAAPGAVASDIALIGLAA